MNMEQGADSGTNYPPKNFLKSIENLLSILIRRLHPQSGMWSKAIIIRKPVADLAYSRVELVLVVLSCEKI